MNSSKFGRLAILGISILGGLVACPASPSPIPTLTTIEGSVRFNRTDLEKCESVTIFPNLKLGSLEPSTVRFRVDFGDGSNPQDGLPTASYSHSYVKGGAFEVKTTATIPSQTQPIFSRTDDVNIIANARDCTYIVELKPPANGQTRSKAALRLQAQSIVAEEGGELLKTYTTLFDGFAARFNPDAATRVQQRPEVAQSDLGWTGAISSTDAQWHLERVAVRERNETKAFEPEGTGAGVDVFVVDTGVRASHEELATRVKTGFVAFNAADTSDSNGHGTHVAALIAGKTAGVARAANIIPVRLTDGDTFNAADLLTALEWIQQQHRLRNKTTVVNMSIGVGTQIFLKDIVDEKLEQLTKEGIVFVIAAGNRGNNAKLFPLATSGCVDGIIVVGAINRADELWAGSNWGDCVDLLAPGVNVTSADKSSDSAYLERTGTSMAAPMVAGMVAQMLEKNPTLTPSEIENSLKRSASLGKINNLTGIRAGTPNRLLYLDPSLVVLQKGISVEPPRATITLGQSVQLTARVRGYDNTAVDWEFNGVNSSGSVLTFTAPSTPGVYTLTATARADASKKAVGVVTVNVPEPRRNVIAAGMYNSFAIKADGTLMGWGTNAGITNLDSATSGGYIALNLGRVGDGTDFERLVPTPVLSDAISVSSSGSHTIALKKDGSIWTWGANSFGQLGDGSTQDSDSPVFVMSDAVSVAAGGFTSYAIKRDGTLWGWGDNSYGQIGDGSLGARVSPTLIMNNVSAVSAGYLHTVALRKDGTVWSWGANDPIRSILGGGGLRLLGIGDAPIEFANLPIRIMSGVTQVAAGYSSSLALKTDGSVWGWGRHEYAPNGSFGSSPGQSSSPKKLMVGISKIGISGTQSFVIKPDGSLWRWGAFREPSRTTYEFPEVQIATEVADVIVSATARHTMFVKLSGAIWVSGYNEFGQLGDGKSTIQQQPTQIMTGVAKVYPGTTSTFALKTDNTLWRWGKVNGSSEVLAPHLLMTDVKQVARDNFYVWVLKTDSSFWRWNSSNSAPQQIDTNVVDFERDYVLKADQNIYLAGGTTPLRTQVAKIFGLYFSGGVRLLGTDGNLYSDWTSPTPLLSNVRDVVGTLAIKSDNTLWNVQNRVQIDSNIYFGLANIDGLYLFVKTDGSLVQWTTQRGIEAIGLNNIQKIVSVGSNRMDTQNSGITDGYIDGVITVEKTLLQRSYSAKNTSLIFSYVPLGNGSMRLNNNFVATLENVKDFAIADKSSFAIRSDDSLWVWGKNENGQLGLPIESVSQLSPIQVLEGAMLPNP